MTTPVIPTEADTSVEAGPPEGWSLARLAEVANDVQPGFACGVNNREGRGIAHLRPMNVSSEGFVDFTSVKYVPPEKADKDERLLRAGDVLFNNTNSPELVGKTAYYLGAEPVAFSNHMTRIRCHGDLLDPQFCAMALHQKWRERYFQSVCNNHVSQSSVGRPVLGDTPLLLPPLAEQRRIVEKVEDLLAEVNAARERLTRVPALLKRFHQSVLDAACSGRLTADWREEHPEIEEAGRPPDEATQDQHELPSLPMAWRWVSLPQLGEMSRGKSRHRPRDAPHLYGGPYPFIQTGDVARSGGRIANHTQTYSESGLEQSRLWPAGTVCITIAANIADSAVLSYPACFPDSVVGFVADASLCTGQYVEFFIRTARDDLSQFAPATAQKNINIAVLSDVMVPLPLLAEQHEIVRRVEALFTLAEAIEARVIAATARAERLTQSILAKAFRGELVPTEAALARREGREYEPASVLLERIRAQRRVPNAPRRRLATGR